VPQLIRATLDGFGIAYIHQDVVREYVNDGRLVQLLSDWTPPFPGYHLYYPSRRHPSPAFTLLVEALRHHD
jgi:DNA-binding transcriptional LysR family regulator